MDIRGDIVKQMRGEKGWTQAHLAEICDVNLRTIQRVENQGSASIETIMALCVAFEVKRQALFKVPEVAELTQNNEANSGFSMKSFLGGIALGVTCAAIPLLYFI